MANAQNLALLTIVLMVAGSIFAVLNSAPGGFDVTNEFYTSGVAHYKGAKMDAQVHANLATNSLEAQLLFKSLGSDWTVQYRDGRSIEFDGDVCRKCFKAEFPDVASMSASARCSGSVCSVNGHSFQIANGANGMPSKVIAEDWTYTASTFRSTGQINWAKDLSNCQCSDVLPRMMMDEGPAYESDNTFEDRRLEDSTLLAPRASFGRGYWRDTSKKAKATKNSCSYSWKSHCATDYSTGYGNTLAYQGSNDFKDWVDNFNVVWSWFSMNGQGRHGHKGITKAYFGVKGKGHGTHSVATGSSLGGGLTHQNGADTNAKMCSYNGPRTLSGDSANNENNQHNSQNAERHYMDDDPVSDMPPWGKHYGKGFDLREKSWFKPCKSKRQGQNDAGESYKVWQFLFDHIISKGPEPHHKKNCKVYNR